MNIGNSISGALFTNELRTHRLALWRIWDRSKDALMFVGLNSSTAKEYRDDPTVIRMACFAKDLGYGGLFMSNLIPFVSPDPYKLLNDSLAKLYLAENDEAIKQMMALTKIHVVGWGEFGSKLGTRPAEVLKVLGDPVWCFKVNKKGEPCHPLYLPRDSKLIEYKRKVEVKNGIKS